MHIFNPQSNISEFGLWTHVMSFTQKPPFKFCLVAA